MVSISNFIDFNFSAILSSISFLLLQLFLTLIFMFLLLLLLTVFFELTMIQKWAKWKKNLLIFLWEQIAKYPSIVALQ